MIIDIINKKRLGKELTKEELKFAFDGYLKKKVKDYQMSSLLMAICINGMSDSEIFDLCDIFIESGDVLDLSDIPGIKVDKHSTGGVGDKTTLVVAPIVASLGVPVVKMSGRGLGYTGGTIDKLESIPGFRTDLTLKQIKDEVKSIGMVVTSQTENLTPIDKVIYALRDVSGTTESIPLIATSIMSKKIASGADAIVIDIKLGKGALIKTKKDADKLSKLMINIGKFYGRDVTTIITDMNNPLGTNIGNSLEVMEAMDVLQDKVHNSFSELCIELATIMVSKGLKISIEEANKKVKNSIKHGLAYNKFYQFVNYQKGNLKSLKVSNKTVDIVSTKEGIVEKIDALEFGKLSVKLGAGRVNKTDEIDSTVGIKLEKLVGDKVKVGDVLCTLYISKEDNFDSVHEFYEIN